ncbi:MAG: hypothetical protein PHW52_00595 [Candidatus Pacebacteria bacterium]|nr:hypothetical protein [Candidatus Paceibacterota bacterium]
MENKNQEYPDFITSEGPLKEVTKERIEIKSDKKESLPRNPNNEKFEQLNQLSQKIQNMRNEMTSFPDLLSKFGLSPKAENRAQMNEEFRRLTSEYQTLKESLRNPFNDVISSKKEEIDAKEASLYPEKKSLFKRLKELFVLKTPFRSKDVA